MQLLVCVITLVAALCFVPPSLATALSSEPICHDMVCTENDKCRVVENVNTSAAHDHSVNTSAAHDHSLNPVCIEQSCSQILSLGCSIGQPLLQKTTDGKHQLRLCHDRDRCPEEFNCSVSLQDAPSRCCRDPATVHASRGRRSAGPPSVRSPSPGPALNPGLPDLEDLSWPQVDLNPSC
ncbi:hypothetical protein ACOMHN_014538 [Nucella lapillus]